MNLRHKMTVNVRKIIVCSLSILFLLSCGQSDKDMSVNGSKNIIYETIKSRRSIRAYKPEQVPQAQLDSILECAIYAPSALNRQSWEIRVIQNAELLKKINQRFVENAKGKQLQGSAAKAQEPGFSVFHGSPTLIIVAKDKANDYSAVDCGLLAQNILLSAESMNLGTCVLGNMAGLLNNPANVDLLKNLELPDTHEVVFGISLGYKNEWPEAKPRKTENVKYVK